MMKRIFALLLAALLLGGLAAFAEGKTWTCPGCGSENDGNFCGNCGAARPMATWTCPDCGAQNDGNFCTNCGAARPAPENAEPVGEPVEEPVEEPVRSDDAGDTQSETLDALTAAAKTGDASAQVRLGMRYEAGEGVERSYTQAMRYYRKAAQQDSAEGWYRMGLMYANGLGEAQSWEQAAACWKKAAKLDSAEAMRALADLYEQGLGVERSDIRAQSLRDSADKAERAPTQAPTPEPTPAPTPEPTPEPAPEPTPAESLIGRSIQSYKPFIWDDINGTAWLDSLSTEHTEENCGIVTVEGDYRGVYAAMRYVRVLSDAGYVLVHETKLRWDQPEDGSKPAYYYSAVLDCPSVGAYDIQFAERYDARYHGNVMICYGQVDGRAYRGTLNWCPSLTCEDFGFTASSDIEIDDTWEAIDRPPDAGSEPRDTEGEVPDLIAYVDVPLILGETHSYSDHRNYASYTYDYYASDRDTTWVQSYLDALTGDYPFELEQVLEFDYSDVGGSTGAQYFFRYTGGRASGFTSVFRATGLEFDIDCQLSVIVTRYTTSNHVAVSIYAVNDLKYAGDYAHDGDTFNGGGSGDGGDGGAGSEWDSVSDIGGRMLEETDCNRCHGNKKITCTQCGGSKKSGGGDCQKCRGTGEIDCPDCGGTGKYRRIGG